LIYEICELKIGKKKKKKEEFELSRRVKQKRHGTREIECGQRNCRYSCLWIRNVLVVEKF